MQRTACTFEVTHYIKFMNSKLPKPDKISNSVRICKKSVSQHFIKITLAIAAASAPYMGMARFRWLSAVGFNYKPDYKPRDLL